MNDHRLSKYAEDKKTIDMVDRGERNSNSNAVAVWVLFALAATEWVSKVSKNGV